MNMPHPRAAVGGRFFRLAAGAGLLAGRAGAAELPIATFDEGLDGFTGAITRDTESPRSGTGAGKMTCSGEERWITASRALPETEHDMACLRLWVRSADTCNLAVRLTDATGQMHQQRPEFPRDGAWHQLSIERFDAGRHHESWGGAADKRWHPPAQRLDLVVEGRGTVWVDDIVAELKPGILPEAAERAALRARARRVVLADFADARKPGFKGAIKVVQEEKDKPGTGFGRIENKNQRWVSATLPLAETDRDFLELAMRVRSRDAGRLAVRLTDATGQNFQQRLAIEADGEWRTLRLTRFDRGQVWGGAGDRIWHPPPRALTIVLEQEGTVDIDDVEALLHPDAVVPDLDVAPLPFGNIFAPGAAVEIAVTSRAERVDWRILDFLYAPVCSGTVAVAGSAAVIRPPVKDNGYYLLHLRAASEGRTLPLGERHVSFAIVPEHRPRDRATSPFGVMTHFAQGMDPAILPLFARIGIVSIRDEHYWAQVEREKGEYVFPEKSDRYMAACRTNDIEPLIVMSFGNKLYDHKDGPSTPAGFEGYGNYGQAILRRYGDQIRRLEIWNEYNGTWAPPSAKESLEARYTTYTAMLKVAHEKIKALRPDVEVLGGACVLIPLPYLEGIFRLGGLDHMDGVVIHPYRASPEGVEKEIDELHALIRKYNGGRDKPVWVTETGRHAKKEFAWEKGRGMYEMGRQEGARYLPRMYTLLLTRGVARIYWYLAADHMDFVTMGLLRGPKDPMGPYAVAPSYVTYATLIRLLDGAEFVRREAWREYTRAHVYHFRRGGDDIRVCWATQPAQIRVKAPATLARVSPAGGTSVLRPEDDGMVLDLTEDVLYLTGKVDSIEEVDTGVRILTDAADDYAKNQGQGNWYYGYRVGDGEFREMTQRETMWGVEWAGPARYLKIARGNMHPEKIDGQDACPVLRWKSPVAGTLRLVGEAGRGSKDGDGVELRVLADGRPLLVRRLGGDAPATTSFDIPVEVREGSLVELTVAPLDGTDYDATSFSLRILQEMADRP